MPVSRISTRRWKVFHVNYSDGKTNSVISTTTVAWIGGGTLGILLGVSVAVCWLLWRLRDRWRNLNPVEVEEFFNGMPVAAESSGAESPEMNAWNLKYNTAYELSSKEYSGQLVGKGEFSKVYLSSLAKSNAKAKRLRSRLTYRS